MIDALQGREYVTKKKMETESKRTDDTEEL